MAKYLAKVLKGEENFWRVFWPWIFGVNGIWLSLFISHNLSRNSFSSYLANELFPEMYLPILNFLFLIYMPLSLYLGSKSEGKGAWGRFLMVVLWVFFFFGLIFFAGALSIMCILVKAGGNECIKF